MNPEDMKEATQTLNSVATGIKAGRKGPGYLVQTRQGKGRTFHSDQQIDGKIPVYLEDGRKMLCRPGTMNLIGFVD